MRGKNSTLKQKLESTATKDIAVCSIVKAELFYGAMKSANSERNLTLQQEFLAKFISLPFDDIATMTCILSCVPEPYCLNSHSWFGSNSVEMVLFNAGLTKTPL